MSDRPKLPAEPHDPDSYAGRSPDSASLVTRDGATSSTPPSHLTAVASASISSSYERKDHNVNLNQDPIPSSEEILGYEQVEQGLGKEIVRHFMEKDRHAMRLAEREQKDNTTLQYGVLESSNVEHARRGERSTRGQWMALCVVLIFAALAWQCIKSGAPTAAALIVGANLTALAASFMYSTKKNSEAQIELSKRHLPAQQPKKPRGRGGANDSGIVARDRRPTRPETSVVKKSPR